MREEHTHSARDHAFLMAKEHKRERHKKQILDQQVDQRLSKALLKDGLDELDELEKEKLCLHEITSLL